MAWREFEAAKDVKPKTLAAAMLLHRCPRSPSKPTTREVVSSPDLAYELDGKLNDYRLAQIKLVREVNLELRMIIICRADGSISKLFGQDMITGETILPGFLVKVGALMPTLPI